MRIPATEDHVVYCTVEHGPGLFDGVFPAAGPEPGLVVPDPRMGEPGIQIVDRLQQIDGLYPVFHALQLYEAPARVVPGAAYCCAQEIIITRPCIRVHLERGLHCQQLAAVQPFDAFGYRPAVRVRSTFRYPPSDAYHIPARTVFKRHAYSCFCHMLTPTISRSYMV